MPLAGRTCAKLMAPFMATSCVDLLTGAWMSIIQQWKQCSKVLNGLFLTESQGFRRSSGLGTHRRHISIIGLDSLGPSLPSSSIEVQCTLVGSIRWLSGGDSSSSWHWVALQSSLRYLCCVSHTPPAQQKLVLVKTHYTHMTTVARASRHGCCSHYLNDSSSESRMHTSASQSTSVWGVLARRSPLLWLHLFAASTRIVSKVIASSSTPEFDVLVPLSALVDLLIVNFRKRK